MRKFLLPTKLLVMFTGVLCLCLSFYGFEYLNKALFIPIILVLVIDVFIILYNLITKRKENKVNEIMHISFYLYIILIYVRLFFDKNMLYVDSVLSTRYAFLNTQLMTILLGIISLTLYQVLIQLEKKKKK